MKFNKMISDYKKFGTLKLCFYKDKTNCSSQIKKAHSIQKNKVLTQLEGNINKNQVLYSFYSILVNDNFQVFDIDSMGKKSASVFTGFCDFHDSSLFSPIENFDFDFSDEHKFLMTYRAFAHSFHQLSETYNYYLSESNYLDKTPKEYLLSHLKITEKEIWKISKYKILIDNLMEKKDYSGINYHLRIIEPFIPIASASILSPKYTYKNKDIHSNIEASYLILNVFPDTTKTVIILSNFKIDKTGQLLFDELKDLPNKEFTEAISSLMIYCTENTFFSPELWNRFRPTQKQRLIDEINFCTDYGDRINEFFKSEINFFKI